MTDFGAHDYRFCPQCFEAHALPAESCPEHGVGLVRLRYPEGSLKGRLIDGKYVILDLLGRGGMGVVYRARQMPIKREVAFKVLNREYLKHPASVKRFIREASAASMLRSRFSAIVHDFGLAREGFLYFTMELAQGNLLADAIKDGTPLEIEEACLVATDICRSLEEAHGLGIIHRDLKPGNVILVQGEDRVLAKVLDFGTARLLTTRERKRITDPGKIFGTPEYMAPEQAMGEEVGPTADLYSLGVMLYETITGALPFTGKTPTHLLLKQIKEKPRSLRVVVPERDVPAPLDDLVSALLNKNPKRRIQSAREVRRTLREILQESFPDAWEESPSALTVAQTTDAGPDGRGSPHLTLQSFGALTPERIRDEERDPHGAAGDTEELGALRPEGKPSSDSSLQYLEPESETDIASRTTRRNRILDPTPTRESGSHRLLPAVLMLLVFSAVIAGGWRVARYLQDGPTLTSLLAEPESESEPELETEESATATATATAADTEDEGALESDVDGDVGVPDDPIPEPEPEPEPAPDSSAERPPPSADSVGTSPNEGGGAPSEAPIEEAAPKPEPEPDFTMDDLQ